MDERIYKIDLKEADKYDPVAVPMTEAEMDAAEDVENSDGGS
jgi:hypothetical protein